MASTINLPEISFISSYENDPSLQKYNQNSLAMFVMKLYLGIDDLDAFAADSITDGGNDKKIDLCYINLDERRAIIGQCYLSPTWGKEAANANKASYINTGLAWLLSINFDDVPMRLKPKAQELREGIARGDIDRIELLFIHNAYSSSNVENELEAAKSAASDLSSKIAKNSNIEPPTIFAKEFGLQEIDELFKSIDSDIVVNHWMTVPATQWIPESSNSWQSIVTSVPATWIQQLRVDYGEDLVSANFRNYLGARSTKTNINYQIKQTLIAEPENFWVFNNGITALTHEIRQKDGNLEIRGISIINGAQTSGALGESGKESVKDAKVLCRIVSSENSALVNKIIRYNNTQNKIIASDKRSNETVFKSLAKEFESHGITFVIRRSSGRNPRDSIVASDIGRVLAAFHGDPQLGYRNPSNIFDDDKTFRKVFPTEITASHICLVVALAKAYDNIKLRLKTKVANEEATGIEGQMFNVLQFTSSRYFITYVIGYISEQLQGQRIVNLYAWKAKDNVMLDSSKLIAAWQEVLTTLLPLINNLVNRQGVNAAFEVPRSAKLSEEVARELQAMIQALDASLSPNYRDLRRYTTV